MAFNNKKCHTGKPKRLEAAMERTEWMEGGGGGGGGGRRGELTSSRDWCLTLGCAPLAAR